LTFEAVRADDFPMLRLGIDAGRRGGAAPAVFNAANEAAVAQFLAGHIRFGDIPLLVERALAELASFPGDSLEALWRADAAARRCVESRLSDAAAHS
jgi:1-deoxy-D-xylulose-5-phosphate reductoisomerase